MAQVHTVNGDIDADELGFTLMHEHIFVKNPELEENWPNAFWDEEKAIADAREALTALAGKGVGTLVDLTVLGLGRYIPRVQRVAEGLPLNIIAATGVYSFRDLPTFFKRHGPGLLIDEPEPLVTMLKRDVTVGIADTGVKAGIIKLATDLEGMTPDLDRLFRAAAVVQRETNVPITTHTHAGVSGGRDQQSVLKEAGVDLERVVIGHCGESSDMDYLRELMDNGSYIGLDRFGMNWLRPEEERIQTVVDLCEQGYHEKITLSHDACYFSVNSEPPYRAEYGPTWNHKHIPDTILPELRKRGVSDKQINQMIVLNPRHILTGGQ